MSQRTHHFLELDGEEQSHLKHRPRSRWRCTCASAAVGGGLVLAAVAAIACGASGATGSFRQPGRAKVQATGDVTMLMGPVLADKIIYIIRHGEKFKAKSPSDLQYEAQCLSEQGWARAYNLKSIFGQRPRPPFKTPDALFSSNYADPVDCRDAHGWYRTQQILAALAANSPGGLNLEVDNSTGFMPALCGLTWNETAKPGFIEHKSGTQPEPYKSMVVNWTAGQPIGGTCSPQGFGGGDGTCCNGAAAQKMLAKLREPGVNTLLVGWEHANIGYLAMALGAPREGVVHCAAADGSEQECWPGHDFDRIYSLRYNFNGEFKSIDTNQFQGFDYPLPGPHHIEYLGPKVRSATAPDEPSPRVSP